MIPIIIKWVKDNQEQVILAIAIVTISLISFNVGRIYTTSNISKSIEYNSANSSKTESQNGPEKEINPTTIPVLDLRVVASKKSTTKKYHFLWCPGAKQINEANKIYFTSDQKAQEAGYSLASNCSK